MTPTVSPTGGHTNPDPPRLRLLQGDGETAAGPPREHSPAGGPPVAESLEGEQRPHQCILLAGGDAARRESLRVELEQLLTRPTRFAEAEVVFEVLEHAPASRLVILAGDLDDASAASLVRVLARRHPTLAVISVAPDLARRAGGHR